MGLIDKPSGVVSQRNSNKIIWEGEVAPGVPLESMDIQIFTPFNFSSTVYPINDRVEFDFKDVIEESLTQEDVMSVFPNYREIRRIKELTYEYTLNGDLENTDDFYFTNGVYQFGYNDVFQTEQIKFLVDKIYAWNSFPIYIPIFLPTPVVNVIEEIDSDISTPFDIDDEYSIYSRVSIFQRLPFGLNQYRANILGVDYFKDLNVLDRCGDGINNLVQISENYDNKSQGSSEYRGNILFGAQSAISSNIPDPEGGLRANNISSLTVNTGSGESNMVLSINSNSEKPYTVSFFAKAQDALGVGSDILIRTTNNINGDMTEVIGVLTLEWKRYSYSYVSNNLYQYILLGCSSRFEFYRFNTTLTPNLLRPIQSPTPFIPLNREKDFYLKWLTSNNVWEFWLFDSDYIEDIEGEYKGIKQGDIYESLGKKNNVTKVLSASNLTMDMFDKIKTIFTSSKVMLLIDNNPVDLKYQEVFVNNDVNINTRRKTDFITLEISEQPFKNN